MKKVFFALAGATALFFGSCISSNKSVQSSPVIARNVTLDPIKADIEVNQKEKLSGESSTTYFLFFRVAGDKMFADGVSFSNEQTAASSGLLGSIQNMFRSQRLEKARSAASFKAIQSGDYDVIVHPNYEYTTENYLWIVKKYTAKVTGYGAKYTNFRTEKQKVIITNSSQEYVFPDDGK